jgi:hypothetical protein
MPDSRIDARSLHPYQHLALPGLGSIDLPDSQDLRRTVLLLNDGSHGAVTSAGFEGSSLAWATVFNLARNSASNPSPIRGSLSLVVEKTRLLLELKRL